jgi:hypothetical protein
MVSDPFVDSFYDKAMATNDVDRIKQLLKDANLRVADQQFSIALLQPLAYSLFQP